MLCTGALTHPRRIVSLLASGTELVCALGAGERLVGRSHECDYPQWVTQLPSLSRPTFDIEGSSRQIDERVRARLREGAPLYEVDEAALRALAPDVILTQTHCEVCAVSPSQLAHGAQGGFVRLVREPVVALQTGTLEGILDGFRAVARVLGCEAEGEALIGDIRARLDAVSSATRDLPHPSVACLEWIDPPFPMGNWGPELVERAGGCHVLGAPGQHSTAVAWDEVRKADPEVLVVAPCGFGMERTIGEMQTLEQQEGWRDMRAVREGRVFVADGNLYFNRSGPSVFDSVRILAEILHGDALDPTFKGRAWRPFRSPPPSAGEG
jgi:iron complex transport system substrate-binding protein